MVEKIQPVSDEISPGTTSDRGFYSRRTPLVFRRVPGRQTGFDPASASDISFRTQRLIAGSMRDEDADGITQILDNPLVSSSFFPGSNIYDPAREGIQLVFRVQSPSVLIGLASIRDSTIAYCVRHEYWGQGLGAEIVGSLVGIVAPALQIPELRAVVLRENLRSRRLLESQGFAFSGLVAIRCGPGPAEWAALAYRKVVSSR